MTQMNHACSYRNENETGFSLFHAVRNKQLGKG